MTSQPNEPVPWPQRKIIVVVEFALIAAIFAADWAHHIFLTKILYLLPLAWLSLRLRGLRWRDVGFRVYRNWGITLTLGVVAGVAIELLELFATQPFLARLTGAMPDLSEFDRVAGSVKWLSVSLASTWTLFAFGEELIYRGYLMNRIAALIGDTRRGRLIALIFTSLVFGLAHFGQGITGVIENVIDGMILGSLYLAFGRSLAIPIIAHGVTDTMDFLLIFFHSYPGMLAATT
jgi:membrane protease YdiL (CAAX protease family)